MVVKVLTSVAATNVVGGPSGSFFTCSIAASKLAAGQARSSLSSS